ncbi:MAG: isocitrate lyase/PEP mutase family protein [Proteobacteria bacterium]|nr:isocitrate lyase/PEP mutase family protein [Pseudomonadota bacterium]
MASATGLRQAVSRGDVVYSPLALDPLTARIAQQCGFVSAYVSGGALGYAYGVSEALLTLTEVADVTRRVVAQSDLAVIVDGGVGFGDPVHTYRAVQEIEATGASAIEIEDQVVPKRVSHHRGVEHLVTLEEMVQKITQAVHARKNEDFLIIARTGAVKNEDWRSTVGRARAYVQAGADLIMLMPETDDQWLRARQEIGVPLAAISVLNRFDTQGWAARGFNIVIDPFTAQVLSVEAVRNAYSSFMTSGDMGRQPTDIFALYRQLPTLAGLDPLFDIERLTTERDD